MNTLGAGDLALKKAQSVDKKRANSEAFFDSASEALLSGRDYGAATHDGVINRISDTEDLIEMLIESRKSGRWSSVEELIDKAIDDEIGEALRVGVAA